MKNKIALLVLLISSVSIHLYAQGPPITIDSPIMLGAKRSIVKTLAETRTTNMGTYTKVPVQVQYLPTAATLVAMEVPMIVSPNGNNKLGDIQLIGKYQFYRKDNMAKTFRVALKAVESLPSGRNFGMPDMGLGKFQSYLGVVAGYESIKYGIANELGYNLVPGTDYHELRHRLGFGLPLLKPVYPVKQVNLYFEYANNWMIQTNGYELLYAQGVQYAIRKITLEAAFQWPLVQTFSEAVQRKYSIFVGTRYVF